MTNYSHTSAEWAEQLEQEYEEYLAQCYDSLYEEAAEDFETVSGQPFCGCQTCETRETIMFLMPRIIEAYKEGLLVED